MWKEDVDKCLVASKAKAKEDKEQYNVEVVNKQKFPEHATLV